MEKLKSASRWKYFNIDRIEEILETHSKAIVLLAGASSSGKSYSAQLLSQELSKLGYKSTIISTDSYNKGVSGIICDKVNSKYFGGILPNMEKIKENVKNCIFNTDFGEKFNKNDLINIKKSTSKLIDAKYMPTFLKALKSEFDIINFDEPSVYDLKKVASDLTTLTQNGTISEKKYSKVISEQMPNNVTIDGKDLDVIIVEGIYALEDDLINNIDNAVTIKNFIESDAKTLFLRRVIRDAKTTSADNCFTIGLYFKYIVPSYLNGILPNKAKADCVFKNDMTFAELHTGDVYSTKQRVRVKNANVLKEIFKVGKIISTEKQRDLYFCGKDEDVSEENLLRLRTIFDENKKEFVPTSLVHKGAIKSRKDNKITRPINVLIKEGDFFKIFESEQDFTKNMQFAGFEVERITQKTRTRVKVGNQTITIDDIQNEGVFVEFGSDADFKIIQQLIKDQSTPAKTTTLDTSKYFD